jgi:DNA-binding Lrp family transcriptional regulator
MKAYVLIKIAAGEIEPAVRTLRKVKFVREAHHTFGPFDAIAEVEAASLDDLGRLIAREIQPIPGILSTLTCLAVQVV